MLVLLPCLLGAEVCLDCCRAWTHVDSSVVQLLVFLGGTVTHALICTYAYLYWLLPWVSVSQLKLRYLWIQFACLMGVSSVRLIAVSTECHALPVWRSSVALLGSVLDMPTFSRCFAVAVTYYSVSASWLAWFEIFWIIVLFRFLMSPSRIF
jgi:hypothetical protein